ncbi:MAG: helix-turn-helix transcriptional regulator [Clostridia bacterium]|nr:helix-turn-helix transcriptional regulator [Clostridia bacterium]
MARASVKENKNIYHLTRESLELTREKASEILEGMSPERIEKIENERIIPHPEDILAMAKGYKAPHLCNHYCSKQCPIGQEYVPEIKSSALSEIILEMLAHLNAMNSEKDRLVEITYNGRIDSHEMDDFIRIQQKLEHISLTVEALQLWCEKMLATGMIDKEEYEKRRNTLKENGD